MNSVAPSLESGKIRFSAECLQFNLLIFHQWQQLDAYVLLRDGETKPRDRLWWPYGPENHGLTYDADDSVDMFFSFRLQLYDYFEDNDVLSLKILTRQLSTPNRVSQET